MLTKDVHFRIITNIFIAEETMLLTRVTKVKLLSSGTLRLTATNKKIKVNYAEYIETVIG